MNIKNVMFSKDGSLFTTSLSEIKRNAKSNLRADFKEFLKENINESVLKSKNVDKLIDTKLNLAENPLFQLTKDVFQFSPFAQKNEKITPETVIRKFKLNATKFLEEATPTELKMLQEYYAKNISEGNILDRWLGSSNKCSDGKDDGKISFFSKVVNVLEGAAKTVVGCVKEIFTNEEKLLKLCIGSAVMLGLSFTTVGTIAIPLLGLFTGGKLISKGGKKILENIKLASQATTDAEAKDRWENVGNGATQAGVGVAVLCGSGKSTYNVFKNGPKSIITTGKNIATTNKSEFKNKDIFDEIAKDIIKDPTNFVED